MLSIKKFYESEKELIEITSIVFIVWGLFLNTTQVSGIGGISIKQIKFFLTFGSTFLLMLLTYKSITHFLQPILDKTQEIKKEDNSAIGLQKQINILVKAITISTFIIFITIIFNVNLLIYLLSNYLNETLYLISVIICYSLFLLYSRKQPTKLIMKFGNLHVWLFVILGVILMVILPSILYIRMFF